MSNRNAGEAGQNRGQIIAHRKVQLPTAFRDRKDIRNFRPCLWTPHVDLVLVFSTKSHRSHRGLRQVIAQLQFGIFQEPGESVPGGERVVAGLGQRIPRQRRGTRTSPVLTICRPEGAS